ncbi:MAG: elongation factor 4 [Deltaproteobacteria bacterium]|nr:elongation factor 4 [Deltaproteobacteria bacterium]MBW2420686.1 elongation factor 4 [Deltaproteobacteria bacterium]
MATKFDQTRIRNFCIVAHIDHGKSTLADRLLDATGALSEREKQDQFLDNMDLERERGITIKAQTARMVYRAADGEDYLLNLIDTPGHVDFSYEVSRALSACEGAVLVVDAAQGIEAQTLANTYLALDADLEIIAVVNKIDLPSADPDRVAQEIEDVVGLDAADAIPVSAKTGQGIDTLLERIVEMVPAPAGDREGPTRALVFDSWFDSYVGAVMLVRVMEGRLRKRDRVRFMMKGSEREISELAVAIPQQVSVNELSAGEVGLVIAGVKTLSDVHIGDTITLADRPASEPLPGFQEVKPMVFSGLYPVEAEDYEDLKVSLEKLKINDSSFDYEPETSAALGFGFRCGFLGFLHAEIIQERLEREYNLNLITTAPTVRYRVIPKSGDAFEIESPAALPDVQDIEAIEEPVIMATIHVPSEHLGQVLGLCQERRGSQKDMVVHGDRVQVRYELPLNEVVTDFHDKLKSATRGYGSFDYELTGYQPAKLVKLDILVNGDPVDALSLIVHKDHSQSRGAELARKLKEFIPRQQFAVAIQAAVGAKVIARTTVKALRKNVTAKCYGGDITRKRKLLEKQKAGKKRMKMVGSVEIPQEAFLAALKLGKE